MAVATLPNPLSPAQPNPTANNEMIDRFTAYLRTETGWSALTIDSYRSDLKQFSEWLAGAPISAAGFQNLRDYVGHLLATVKASRAARKVSTLRNFFEFLFMDRLIKIDPMHRVQSPKIGKTLPNFFSVGEMDSILSAPASRKMPRDRAMLELLYGAGLRVSELAGARLGDLNLTDRLIMVHGKGDKERVAPFGHRAAIALKLYLETRAFRDGFFLGIRESRLLASQYGKSSTSVPGRSEEVLARTHCVTVAARISWKGAPTIGQYK